MLKLDQYDVAVRDLLRNKQAAKSDESQQAWDQVWSDMLCARNHARLVARFRELSASARNQAAIMTTRPGFQREAEAQRIRATELHEIAERHSKAADRYQQDAESAMSDCVAMTKRENEQQNGQQQNGEQQNGEQQNGGGISDTGDVPQPRRRTDRRQVREEPQSPEAQMQRVSEEQRGGQQQQTPQ